MASANGARIRHNGLNRDAPNRKIAEDTTTNVVASHRLIAPRGSSRMAVRGLSASHRASTTRLNPMAALRTLTMQTTIHPTWLQENGCTRQARSAPVSANGSANTEWLKRTNER